MSLGEGLGRCVSVGIMVGGSEGRNDGEKLSVGGTLSDGCTEGSRDGAPLGSKDGIPVGPGVSLGSPVLGVLLGPGV